jgi:hypothetical protein
MLEYTEGLMKNGKYRETPSIRYTRHRTKSNKTKTKCTHHYARTTTNNKELGGKDEHNLVVCGNRNGHQSTEL